MKKTLMSMMLVIAFILAVSVPSKAGDGIIIHLKQTPTPTPTPVDETGGRNANQNENPIPSFWEFLSYFGL